MPRKLRVVHIVESFLSGTFQVLRTVCNRLDPEEFEVWILHSLREHSPRGYRDLIAPHVRLVHVPMEREIRPAADLAAFRSILAHLRAIRPDIAHTHSSKAGFLGRWAARWAGVPRILHSPHGYSFLMTDARRPIFFLLERMTGGATVAVSRAEAAWARRVAGPIHVIPNAVDVNGVAAPERREVAVCGRLTAARNPELVSRLAARVPDAPFVWIGDGEARAGLHGVQVTGWLPRIEALRRLAGAAVVVHPSRWEGLPLTVLEAMALGRAVVASDIPAHREILRPGVNGFLARRLDDYEAWVRRLLADPTLRGRIGQAAREDVSRRFDPDRMAAAYAHLYRGAAP